MSFKNLLESILEAGRIISETPGNRYIAVLTHYDADGLSAGGALLRLLEKLGKKYVIRSVTELNDNNIKKFFMIKAHLHIIADLGSGELEKISQYKSSYNVNKVLIIDHHKISGDLRDLILVNPELYGIDGGSADCTAVLSSYIGYKLLKDPYFTEIGIIGATGDMQIYEPMDLTLNILEEAISKGVAKHIRDFIFFQNRSLPIFKAITWTYVPYIPNFSGRDDIGLMLVKKAGIDINKGSGAYTTVDDLSNYEKNRLLEEILHYILGLGVDDLKPRDLMSDIIIFTKEEHPLLKYSQDFSSLVSTAGRLGKDFLGILITSGLRDSLINELEVLYEERRKLLSKYMSYVEENLKIIDNIVIVDLRNMEVPARFGGTISTLLSRSLIYSDKVILVLLRNEDAIKISSRAPKKLVDEGLDLSLVMRDVAKKYGGHGGGHNVAAGASILREDGSLVNFLVDLIKSYLKR